MGLKLASTVGAYDNAADLYPTDFSWVPSWGDKGKRDTNDQRGVLTSGICERSVQIDYDEEVTFRAIQNICDLARSDDRRPFFMQVSYTHPHEPYLCRKEYWDLYEGRSIPLPDVGALPEGEHDPHSLRLLADFGILNVQFREQDVLRARRAYYGSISYVDRMIGRILEALTATGAAANTAIVFTSDHGEMLGERGMWFKKHFFEKSMRVPLMIYAPWIPAQRISELVSLVDLLPTFNGLATGNPWSSPVEELEGTDLTRLLDRADPQPERAVHAEYLAESTLAPMFMIRRGRYKFVSCSQDLDLLFDLQADPNETENLAENPALKPVVEAFRGEVCDKWCEPELSERIRLSQRRRALIRTAMGQGTPNRWNHGESPGDKVLWYRGEGSYNEWAFDYLPVGPDA